MNCFGQRCNEHQRYDGAANNISFTMRMDNAEAVEPAFARAHHVTRLPLRNNRWAAR